MNTTLTNSSVVVASEHQTSSQVDDERVILDLEEGVYYGLNDVGARVWELIQEPATVEEIIDAVTSEYDVSADQCTSDVKELLDDLESRGLIRVK